jgi:hypothetical protein
MAIESTGLFSEKIGWAKFGFFFKGDSLAFGLLGRKQPMRLRFNIRDLLWLTVVVALAVGWWLDYQRLTAREEVGGPGVVEGFPPMMCTFNSEVSRHRRTGIITAGRRRWPSGGKRCFQGIH